MAGGLRLSLPFGPLALAGAVALSALRLSVWSYQRGYRAAEMAQSEALATAQAQRDRAAAVARQAEVARLAVERDRAVLAAELEDMARADGNGGRAALGVDSVRRLNRR